MSFKITEIEGIGPARAATLETAGIKTTDQLLDLCADAKGRTTVAETTGISTTQLFKWAYMADLMRISGVGQEYSELLEAAGVDAVKERRTRCADNLTAKMADVNAEKTLVRSAPTEAAVTRWIELATTLEPRIAR